MHVQAVLKKGAHRYASLFYKGGAAVTKLTHGSFKRRVDGPSEVTSQSVPSF
jgi:hypothetical protein